MLGILFIMVLEKFSDRSRYMSGSIYRQLSDQYQARTLASSLQHRGKIVGSDSTIWCTKDGRRLKVTPLERGRVLLHKYDF